jgi:hypothetical protein
LPTRAIIGDRAGGEGGEDLLCDPAAVGEVAGLVGGAEQLGALPGDVTSSSRSSAAMARSSRARLPVGVSLSSRSAIDGTDLLRHGGMDRLFGGARAPSTLGTFLRCFTFGHVRQLDAVAAGLLVNLAWCTPLLPGADQVAFVDVDDTVRQTHGYAKQGVGYGYTGTKGLNALIATVSTPVAAPGIAATRLRRGSANSARGGPGWSPTRSRSPVGPARAGC